MGQEREAVWGVRGGRDVARQREPSQCDGLAADRGPQTFPEVSSRDMGK
jgi:hypothetical protein